MASDKVHIGELCSQLYGINCIEEDTDVTIQCEGRQFLCHRSVLAARSTYFECMFRNAWRESVTGTVTFAGEHMQVDTLLAILKYIYAGTASITSSNLVDLLYAGDYLGVLGLQADCIRLLPQFGPELIEDLWEALVSAHSTFNQPLISVLESCNLTERLKKFFNTNEFLRIPADLLSIIVTKLWKAPPTTNHILLGAIYRWRAYDLNERMEHALKLHQLLEPALENSFELSESSLVSSNRETTVAAPTNPSLHVYAKDTYLIGTSCRMKTYKYGCEDSSEKKFVLECSYRTDIKIRDLRFVSVDNVGLFNIATTFDETERSTPFMFHQFASEDFYGFQCGLALTPLPIYPLHEHFDLCNLSNRGLYLLNGRHYESPPRHNPKYDASKQDFSEEEIQRDLYFFNIELDRWLPVPAMLSHSSSRCMTVLNDMVYVIAGNDKRRIVQAYDHRERKWHSMPNTLHYHIQPQSCVLDGRIYVSSSRSCERYDPVAARWEDIIGFESTSFVRRLIPYKNELWQLQSCYGRHFIQVYNPITKTCSFVEIDSPMIFDYILDAVVW